MARKKNEVLKALRETHIRAIGKVAAQWSVLEITILFVIAKVLNVEFRDAVAVCGSQNATAWCDMLKKLTKESKSTGAPKRTVLDNICQTISELQTKRNDIVHGYWHPRKEVATGLLGLPLNPSKPPELASGIVVPKRGVAVFRQIEMTPSEMLKTANEIAKAERELFDWYSQRQKRLLTAQQLTYPSTMDPQTRNKLRDLLATSPASKS